ncbi:hypothetical protein [Paenibacillus crassostreae]|uniref:hypothetical protein n=1 Tax=Paenibacillus crassostreae TaxID=1763538 RepID=UPI000B0A3A60|nr:hypothetical protein [Paenibacillus crassostreae]
MDLETAPFEYRATVLSQRGSFTYEKPGGIIIDIDNNDIQHFIEENKEIYGL